MFKLTNHRQSGFILPALAALLLQAGLLISCTDSKKNPESGAIVEKTAFKMNCVTLTKMQMQAWVDSGWTRPGNPDRVKTLLLQFFSPDAAGLNSNMQLTAYPGISSTDVKITGNTLLAVDRTCKPKTFSGPVILANNEISIDSLKVLNADGTLKDFEYIRFIPQSFGRNTSYISFNAEVIRKGETENLLLGPTKPCPPYCCPPYCVE